MRMTRSDDSIPSPAAPAQSAGSRWLYPALLAVQTIGAVVLFWNGVPLYQQILADPASHEAKPETLAWVLSSIVLMQAGYWISNRFRPSLPQFINKLLGHLTLFLARMSFVFPTSIFGFLVFAQKPGFQIPAFRYVAVLMGLFALYCYTRELDRFGNALLGEEKKANATMQ